MQYDLKDVQNKHEIIQCYNNCKSYEISHITTLVFQIMYIHA
jgi:hypothetical protein